MSMPTPGSIQTATVVLGLLAALTALSGLGTTVALGAASAFDPTLHGDWTLPATLVVAGLAVTLFAASVPVGAAIALRTGQLSGRIATGFVAVLLLGTPLLPVGAWLLYVVGGGPPLARVWFDIQARVG